MCEQPLATPSLTRRGLIEGSSLRSDRAHARPSGLDTASAQLLDWQLRDGRQFGAMIERPYVLSASFEPSREPLVILALLLLGKSGIQQAGAQLAAPLAFGPQLVVLRSSRERQAYRSLG